jgi:hypothetical protein
VHRLIVLLLLIAISPPAAAFFLLSWNVAQGSVESLTRREADIARLEGLFREKGRLPDVALTTRR